ncbi:LysE family translocator [Streptosporangium sp. NPDC048047]|uniref:LysE family translocator n=1 Tax=Streptosporangium sp. NPDC048047 TaxID=3155748 RepID=UPI00344AF41F
MVSTGAVIGVAGVALGMVLTPGPNMVHLVSRSVAQGRRAGLIALAGVAAGFGVYLVAAVAGIAAVFAVVPALYAAVKFAGAAYLLWLAWRVVRPGAAPMLGGAVARGEAVRAEGAGRLFSGGLVTNLLNPKIAVLYVSLLPQFVDPARGGAAAQSLVLGLVQIAVAVSVNALFVVSAGSIAGFVGRRPVWARVQRYLTGTVLAAVAVRVAVDRSGPVAAAA